jgi:tetratricopeptide (TPR) repeat protein
LALLAGGLVVRALQVPKDDPAAPLVTARAQLAEGAFDAAIDTINKKLLPAYNTGRLTDAQSAEVYLIRARALWGGQLALGIDLAANYKSVVADLDEAVKHGATLTDADERLLTEALILSGDRERALAKAKALAPKDSAARTDVFKRVIAANLADKDPRYEQTIGLLSELMEDPQAPEDELAWALARQTELRLRMGFHDEAITRLLRTLPRLAGSDPRSRGELLFLLGKAYHAVGDTANASKQLDAAQELLPEADPVLAEAMVMSGQILQSGGRLEEARERFERARDGFTGTDAVQPALLGLAETLAAMDDDPGAVENYEKLLDLVAKSGPAAGLSRAGIGRSLMDRAADRETSSNMASALRFGLLAETAFTDGQAETPAELLVLLGRAHRALGDRLLEDARTSPQGRLPIAAVSPVTQAEVKRHFMEAGTYLREHARRMVAADIGVYLRSTWASADAFDQGGLADDAKKGFSAYRKDAPDDDPGKGEAAFRLAELFRGEGDFVTAASLYRPLVEARGAGGAPSGGLVGDRALVPLAQCYLRDDVPANDDDARRLLEPVVSDGRARPDSVAYRDALVELGEFYHRKGEYARAVERLTEAVDRYPGHERAAVLVYKLGDANRLAAAQLDADLAKPMPQARRDELRRYRAERLAAAHAAYQRVGPVVAAKDERRRTPLDTMAARNALFYLGDVAFEQGDFDAAIAAYDAARQAYASEPAALVAMVQIVNAYAAQGRWPEAITANARAQQQLAALPESAWNDPNLPMERKHWERWLDTKRLIEDQRRSTASGE